MNDNYQEEINLIDIFFYVLRRIKKLIICGLIVGLAFSGFMGFKAYKKQIKLNEYAVITKSEYKTFEQQKDKLSAAINDRRIESQNYMNDSAFLSLDPYNTYEATATYYISTDYKIILESQLQEYDYTNSILTSYVKMLKDSNGINEIEKKYNINDLNEYIFIYIENHLLNINVFNEKEEIAQSILEELQKEIPTIKKQIESTIGKNNISLVKKSTLKGIESDLLDLQNSKTQKLSAIFNVMNDLQTNLDKLEKPALKISPLEKGIKTGIKNSITGFFLGFFFLAFIYCMQFMMKNVIYSTEELQGKTNIRILGSFKASKEIDKISNWVNKKENRAKLEDSERNYRVIASNIRAYLDSDEQVLLSCDSFSEKTTEFVNTLQKLLPDIQIICKGSILNNFEAIRELKNCKNVILLLECNKSTYKSIIDEKEKLKDLNKNLLGSIVIE